MASRGTWKTVISDRRQQVALNGRMGCGLEDEDAGAGNVLVLNSHVLIIVSCFTNQHMCYICYIYIYKDNKKEIEK